MNQHIDIGMKKDYTFFWYMFDLNKKKMEIDVSFENILQKNWIFLILFLLNSWIFDEKLPD